MRGIVTPRSMIAFYLSGIEDRPERSGEICVAEIFGEGVGEKTAAVGIGLKALRDPSLRWDFSADPLDIDVADFNAYSVDWRPGSLEFSVNGSVVRQIDQAPDYPVQLMIGVFDFPAKAVAGEDYTTPELAVTHVRGRPLD